MNCPNRPSQEYTVGAGDVAEVTKGCNSVKVILTPAAAVSTVVVKSNGSSGPVVMTLQAAANGQTVESPEFLVEGQMNITITGASAKVYVLH